MGLSLYSPVAVLTIPLRLSLLQGLTLSLLIGQSRRWLLIFLSISYIQLLNHNLCQVWVVTTEENFDLFGHVAFQ